MTGHCPTKFEEIVSRFDEIVLRENDFILREDEIVLPEREFVLRQKCFHLPECENASPEGQFGQGVADEVGRVLHLAAHHFAGVEAARHLHFAALHRLQLLHHFSHVAELI